jgi:hypothetical protein
MNRNIAFAAISSNRLDGVTSAIREVGIGSVNANGILIDVSFHTSNIHLILTVTWHYSDFNVQVITGLESSHMSSCAKYKIRLFHSFFPHLIFPIGKYRH